MLNILNKQTKKTTTTKMSSTSASPVSNITVDDELNIREQGKF